MRKWLLALLALLIVTPALAQVMRLPRPVVIQPLPAPSTTEMEANDIAEKTMTVEEARKKIFELYREKRELNAKLTEALATIQQMTTREGSQVRAYCESKDVSRNTAGATENCADSGFSCSPVDGLCRKSCTVATDCAGYFNCDAVSRTCVRNG